MIESAQCLVGMNNKTTSAEAAKLILDSNGAFITVEFIKRTTGELRTMNCRTGVKKHLKGGVLGYDREEHKLIGVYDMVSGGYRSIPIENIRKVTAGGKTVEVEAVA